MRRKTFDIILASGGLVLTIVLVVAGSLLMWGYHFANSNVHDQLAQQQITFPTAAARSAPTRRASSPSSTSRAAAFS